MAGGIRHALWAACFLIVGCGGGGGADSTPPPASPSITSFSSDQPGYFVGGTAQLTAVFQNGNGRLDPGNIAVTSGQPITTPVLSEDVTYRLTVSSSATSVTRDLAIDVSYRERFRTLNMPFSRAEHAAVNLPDGRVLIVGGDEWGNTLPSAVYQFHPASETFTKFGDLSTGRVAMIAVTLANGDVLVGYGGRALTQAPPAEIINGATGTSMPTIGVPHHPRYYATATLLADGRVLIAGGSGNGIADPTAEIYDPSTAMFTLLQATLSKGRYSHTATRLSNGRVLIYGGHTGDNLPAPPELFDPATLVFTPLAAPENVTRANHTAVTSRDGRVWIVGGEDQTSTPIASVLRFDAETLFALGPTLGVPRSLFVGGPLTDGRIFLCGGVKTFTTRYVESTSEFVIGLQNRAAGPSMSGPRFLHTVSTLPNGKVLVVGGLSDASTPLSTAEIFE